MRSFKLLDRAHRSHGVRSAVCHHAGAWNNFDGKVAVVTGAGSGIGRALVHAFAAEGDAGRRGRRRSRTRSPRPRSPRSAITTLTTDVTRFDDVAALADHTYATFGQVDVLCNNAGVFAGGLMWERPPSDFEWTLGVNLWGILHGIRAFVPRMIAAGNARPHREHGVDGRACARTPFTAPYNVSKFAALAATECLAHDLARDRRADRACRPSSRRGRHPHRRRPAATGPTRSPATTTDDAAFVEQALIDLTAATVSPPEEVAAMILDAIRTNTYPRPDEGRATAPTARSATPRSSNAGCRPMPNFD